MRFDLRRLFLPLLVVLLVPSVLPGQENIPPARLILGLGELEQAAFIKATMDLGFPSDRADQMTMLIINRSALALPLIEERLEADLRSQPPSPSFIETASEMIAYAGDEHALRAIGKLIAIDEVRFAPLVGRALTHAMNWRNPLTVAYRGLELGDGTVSRHVVGWVEAMLDRYGKVPDDEEWSSDPIAIRLTRGTTAELRPSVQRYATEALAKRDRR
jgi:hypothetical protein